MSLLLIDFGVQFPLNQDNIMAATYFACADEAYDNQEGLIWILDPFQLNMSASVTRRAIGIALSNYFDTKVRTYQSIIESYDELFSYYSNQLIDTLERPCTKVSGKEEAPIDIKTLSEFLDNCMQDKNLRDALHLPIAVEPGNVNPRINAQKGKFTINSGKQYFSREEKEKQRIRFFDPPTSLMKKGTDFLRCVLIPARAKYSIRNDLRNIFGIDESSLMLDLDYHGKVAANIYSCNKP